MDFTPITSRELSDAELDAVSGAGYPDGAAPMVPLEPRIPAQPVIPAIPEIPAIPASPPQG